MPQFRHVGTQLLYHQNNRIITVRRFGETVDLDDAQAAEFHRQRAALVTPAQFDSVGFTADELSRWASPFTWRQAPKEFLAKVEQSHTLARQNFEQAQSQVEASPPPRGPIPDLQPTVNDAEVTNA